MHVHVVAVALEDLSYLCSHIVRWRYRRGSLAVRSRNCRGSLTVRSGYCRGSVEELPRFGGGTVEVRWRY